MKAIYKRELSTYFRSPIGWIAIAIATGFAGFFFFVYITGGAMDIAGEIAFVQSSVLFISPIITMRLFSEEKKNGTEVLLYTNPISLLSAVAGKFFAAMTLLAVMLFSTIFHAFVTAFFGGRVDATFLGALISFLFVSAVFIAIGLLISAATENQIVAAIISFVIVFVVTSFFGLIASSVQSVVQTVLNFFTGFGLSTTTISTIGQSVYDGIIWADPISRLGNINLGVFEISPLVYCLSLVAFFLFLTYRILEKRRWSQG